jgi:hypothetical protein
MALSQTNNTKLEHVTSFRERRDRMLTMSASKRFPLTRQLEDIVTCTPQTLAGRQQETVELIAQYWGIPYDHQEILPASTQPDQHVADEPDATRVRTSRRVTIAAVLRAGLLTAGEQLEWKRPRKGELWKAEITSQGTMRLENGTEYTTPTAAARAVGGGSQGLNVWKRSDGTSLADIWKQYRMRG